MNKQDELRHRYPINCRAFVGMAAAGAASPLLARAAAAQPVPKARNVVFVHGLFADGSCWSEVIARLQPKGINVTAVQNPLTSLKMRRGRRAGRRCRRARPCLSRTPSAA